MIGSFWSLNGGGGGRQYLGQLCAVQNMLLRSSIRILTIKIQIKTSSRNEINVSRVTSICINNKSQ